MSLAYASFSGANHATYEHSIGAMHVAYNLAMAMKNDLETYVGNKWIDVLQFVRIRRFSMIWGHPPFSHAIEEVFKKNINLAPKIHGDKYNHDTYTRQLITENKQIMNILNNNDFSPNQIANILENFILNVV